MVTAGLAGCFFFLLILLKFHLANAEPSGLGGSQIPANRMFTGYTAADRAKNYSRRADDALNKLFSFPAQAPPARASDTFYGMFPPQFKDRMQQKIEEQKLRNPNTNRSNFGLGNEFHYQRNTPQGYRPNNAPINAPISSGRFNAERMGTSNFGANNNNPSMRSGWERTGGGPQMKNGNGGNYGFFHGAADGNANHQQQQQNAKKQQDYAEQLSGLNWNNIPQQSPSAQPEVDSAVVKALDDAFSQRNGATKAKRANLELAARVLMAEEDADLQQKSDEFIQKIVNLLDGLEASDFILAHKSAVNSKNLPILKRDFAGDNAVRKLYLKTHYDKFNAMLAKRDQIPAMMEAHQKLTDASKLLSNVKDILKKDADPDNSMNGTAANKKSPRYKPYK